MYILQCVFCLFCVLLRVLLLYIQAAKAKATLEKAEQDLKNALDAKDAAEVDLSASEVHLIKLYQKPLEQLDE